MDKIKLARRAAAPMVLAAGALVLATGAARSRDDGAAPQAAKAAAADAAAPDSPADRRVFYGELHLHTTLSFDAWTFGTKVTPDQAYKFARGETVMVSPAQLGAEQGMTTDEAVPAKRSWPLDFAAVTDHSEFLGAVAQLDDPNSGFSKSDFGKSLKAGGRGAFFRAAAVMHGGDSEAAGEMKAAAQAADGWAVETKAVRDNYQPGRFTTLLAYEWTSSPGHGIHMHRNVIFEKDHAPAPFTSVDSTRPEDLWAFMDGVRKTGLDLLAIPHNSNLSDGLDFDWNNSDGRPIDAAYALQRARNEPLVEISQVKGTSETTPELSPSDEFAGFEIMDRIYAGETEAKQNGSYVRQGWGRGLVIESKTGANPFKMGVVGASDIHNGLSTSEEEQTPGASMGFDPRTMPVQGAALKRTLGLDGDALSVRPNGQRENDPLQMSSAAITGVWAEENTRPAIFAALKRKETFATSGTRIRVRMFGGWSFAQADLKRPDWIRRAYAAGVPMGGDLPAAGAGKAPSFIVQAAKDPTGANLDRVQIIKVWLAGDGYREKVFDVALSDGRAVDPKTGKAPAVRNTVDLKTGRYANSVGAKVLTQVWTDPDFDPKAPAVYYARVIEIPTPRWTTLMALRNHLPLPEKAPATIQERAWTSPIWYDPPKTTAARAASRRNG
ncbi:DUF3604 domain-containing protein [Phenylobacterium sp.]|uniref:DUF3604 domain-containing protein n=1 Tax=Phenylobacterium sp. TaxID=1871053 RepID=UPI0025D29263|nr:DUF3604 domain-containing protein [Phenylobacterium sp.]